MKKLLLPLLFFAAFLPVLAQPAVVEAEGDTTYWSRNGMFGLNFTRISLSQWAKGGEASTSGLALMTYRALYERDNHAWESNIETGFGLIRTKAGTRKNEDKIDLLTKYGRRAVGNFFYTGLVNLRTQYATGYSELNDTVPTSAFMAPGFLLTSIGMDWKPRPYFSLFVSPATGKFTFVLDNRIDETSYGLDPGATVRPEFGAYVSAIYDREILTNTLLKLKLDLFNNFTDPVSHQRANVDVNFEGNLAFKIKRYFSVNFFNHLIYDHDIDVPKEDSEGNEYMGKGLQVKQVIGVGFSYIF